MRCLIRRITRKGREGTGHRDQTVTADALRIGRSTDQEVFLGDLHVALRHATLRPAEKGYWAVQAHTPSGVQLDGRTVQSGTVQRGDTINIGRTELRLRRPPSGYDLLLEIDEAAAQEGRHHGMGAVTLRQAGLRKRPWAWLAFLVVLGLGLGVPMAQIHYSEAPAAGMPVNKASAPSPPDGNAPFPWRMVGGDHLWQAGPMSEAHQFFGRECRTCHRRPFQRVDDSACLGCHQDQPHHADDAAMMARTGLSSTRCSNCHSEHDGDQGLSAGDSALCVDCHGDPAASMPSSDTQPVTGFGNRRHPPFRVAVRRLTESETFTLDRKRLDPLLRERTGVKFPHATHMNPEGIAGPDGDETLACRDCHGTGPEGVEMQPVAFDANCQRCHRLDFEPNARERQVPHGKPAEIVKRLEEFYARVALAGGYRNPKADPPEVVRQRRPGPEKLSDSKRRVALDWAQQRAGAVADDLIVRRSCSTCHSVERRPDAPGGWHITPVELTQDWMAGARFTHVRHRQVDCTRCHAAEQSETAEDVLMPGVDTCADCHDSETGTARIQTPCVDCHTFHRADSLTMGGRTDEAQGD